MTIKSFMFFLGVPFVIPEWVSVALLSCPLITTTAMLAEKCWQGRHARVVFAKNRAVVNFIGTARLVPRQIVVA